MQLPLFPLNSVLFPGMPLHLHIFEPRYRQMMRRCLEGEGVFGVVLIREGAEALGPLAEPHRIGCSARIERVQPLAGGRMHLQASGDARFRILDLSRERAYLVGEVEPIAPVDDDRSELARQAIRLRPWVKRYAEILARSTGSGERSAVELPDDPESLAWAAAHLLQLPGDHKQALLAAERPISLLTELRRLFRREIPLLEKLGGNSPGPLSGPFSRN